MLQQQKLIHPRAHEEGKAKSRKRVRLTQKAIVAVAAELFARKGFGATSLDDIADQLGATKGALYYHVRNKEEILRLICLMVMTACEEPLALIARAQLAPEEKLSRAIAHQIAVAADRSPAMMVCYREQVYLTGPFAKEVLLRKKAYERCFEQIIEEGQTAGVFTSSIDAKVATFGLLGMCNWLSQWYKPGGPYPHQQIAAMLVQMVENGLAVSSPTPPHQV